jgi:hypothetical protein
VTCGFVGPEGLEPSTYGVRDDQDRASPIWPVTCANVPSDVSRIMVDKCPSALNSVRKESGPPVTWRSHRAASCGAGEWVRPTSRAATEQSLTALRRFGSRVAILDQAEQVDARAGVVEREACDRRSVGLDVEPYQGWVAELFRYGHRIRELGLQ